MSNLLLVNTVMPEGWWDCSIGEPHMVRDTLIDIFNLQKELKKGYLFEEAMIYPSPTGYKPLVKLLEDKHQAPIIITNGAKQALGAVFYAIRKLGWNHCSMKSPYWALIPPLAKMHGVDSYFESGPNPKERSPFLLLAPNNPDGACESAEELLALEEAYQAAGIPLIHDGAYYTHIYLPETHSLPVIGDVQIYSISKMLGLSGLRIGYVVCKNIKFYKLIQEYMEAMTVGVSINSQTWLHEIFSNYMGRHPELTKKFEKTCAEILKNNKQLCRQINPEVLQVPNDIENQFGMFGWFGRGPKADFDKAKIKIISGDLFGDSSKIRMNLAWSGDQMQEIVRRLNNV